MIVEEQSKELVQSALKAAMETVYNTFGFREQTNGPNKETMSAIMNVAHMMVKAQIHLEKVKLANDDLTILEQGKRMKFEG